MTSTIHIQRPGLTLKQAENLARRIQREGAEKARRIEVTMPGDVHIDPTMMLALSGTGTSADQEYFIETIVHEFSFDRGYTMTVTAKNSKPGDAGSAPGQGDNESSGGSQTFAPEPGFDMIPNQDAG